MFARSEMRKATTRAAWRESGSAMNTRVSLSNQPNSMSLAVMYSPKRSDGIESRASSMARSLARSASSSTSRL